MESNRFTALDVANGVGSIAIAILAVFYLAFFGPIESLGPFAVFFLLATGGILAYGSYEFFSRV